MTAELVLALTLQRIGYSCIYGGLVMNRGTEFRLRKTENNQIGKWSGTEAGGCRINEKKEGHLPSHWPLRKYSLLTAAWSQAAIIQHQVFRMRRALNKPMIHCALWHHKKILQSFVSDALIRSFHFTSQFMWWSEKPKWLYLCPVDYIVVNGKSLHAFLNVPIRLSKYPRA